jgi:hypothetical protein
VQGEPLRIVLELEPGVEPVKGSASTASEPSVRFDGLMELVAAIDSLRASRPGGGDAGAFQRGGPGWAGD